MIDAKAQDETITDDLASGPTNGDLFRSDYLSKLGFKAKTIIDVGVRHGTKELYKSFPESLFLLIDPQKGGESLLRVKPVNYVFINKGLGAQPGKLTLHEEGGRSSLLTRANLNANTVRETYEVEITTLDAILAAQTSDGPIGLKIDTEGYELEVLKGIRKSWPDIEFIICEASVRRRFIGSYQFSELVTYLGSHGFVFFNILNTPQKFPRFYDVLFIKESSALLG